MTRFSIRPTLTPQRKHVFGDSSHRGVDVISMGRLAEAGQAVSVDFDASGEFVMGIFGKRGSGKSYCLGAVLESLCTVEQETSIGRNSRTKAVLVFDTLNIFWTLEESLHADVGTDQFPDELSKLKSWGITPPATSASVFVPSGFRTGSMPSSYSDLTLAPSALDADDWADLIETDLYSDRLGQLLFDVYSKVSIDGWASEDGQHSANPRFQVSDLLECLRADADIASHYSPETVRALSQRLRAVSRLKFIGGAGTSLRSLLLPGHACVLLMNRLPETMRAVLTSVLMRRILSERSEASEITKQLKLNRKLSSSDRENMTARLNELIPPTVVALDEAQNVLPSERATKATSTIIRYVREGRNHGLSFVFTTQQPSAIDARILAQVDTIVGHKLTIAADVRRFDDNLKSRLPDTVQVAGRDLNFGDWLRSLDPGQAIVSNTEESRAFALDVRPRVCPHGGQGTV